MRKVCFVVFLLLMLFMLNVNPQIEAAWESVMKSSQTLRDGRILTRETSDDLILGSDNNLENAKVEARGQFLQTTDTGSIIATSYPVQSISASNITLKSENKTFEFAITKNTDFCEGKKRLSWKDVVENEIVTVITDFDGKEAIIIKKGAMLLGDLPGLSSGPTVLLDYQCN